MLTKQRMTYDDLMGTPDDGNRHELVRGEILCMPPPMGDHGDIEAALVGAVDRYLHERAQREGWRPTDGLAVRSRLVGRLISGEAGIRFRLPDDPDQTRGVDAGYLSPEQVARVGASTPTKEYIPEVPALVAEVISSSQTVDYIEDKVADYLVGGARLVWLLFPRSRSVRVCRPDGSSHTIRAGGVLDGDEVLPGFSVALVNLFP